MHKTKFLILFLLITNCTKKEKKTKNKLQLPKDIYKIPKQNTPKKIKYKKFKPPVIPIKKNILPKNYPPQIFTHKQENKIQIITDPFYKNQESDVSSRKVNRNRILTTDRIIPAILTHNINSNHPGSFIAIVERDILSHPNILLPAYTKIIGKYQPLKPQDKKLSLSIDRIIRPDGVHIKIHNMHTCQFDGTKGVHGKINNHTKERYQGLTFTVIIAALEKQILSKKNSFRSILDPIKPQIQKILQQKLDIKPEISIPAGTKIILMPENDIIFQKPFTKITSQ